jgi:hypothetical protein
MPPKFSNIFWYYNIGQTTAPIETMIFNNKNFAWYCNAVQIATALETTFLKKDNIGWQGYFCEIVAFRETFSSNLDNGVRYCNVYNASTSGEAAIS